MRASQPRVSSSNLSRDVARSPSGTSVSQRRLKRPVKRHADGGHRTRLLHGADNWTAPLTGAGGTTEIVGEFRTLQRATGSVVDSFLSAVPPFSISRPGSQRIVPETKAALDLRPILISAHQPFATTSHPSPLRSSCSGRTKKAISTTSTYLCAGVDRRSNRSHRPLQCRS
jgi:hypothetical protein